jgi:hypothetical protein
MLEEVKRKVLDHALVADTDPDATSPELGRPCKWIGEKGAGEFSW